MTRYQNILLMPHATIGAAVRRLQGTDVDFSNLASNRDQLLASIRKKIDEADRIIDAIESEYPDDASWHLLGQRLRACLRAWAEAAETIHLAASGAGETSTDAAFGSPDQSA
ncbi:hypothetical protein [Bradyrhizobium mercantei]|uniref:hypothetical protein n=1 Tax=Bradyrhizobium mercantei TaxID=1904807 RepID=UPI0009759A0D|nr:hypothetical protein [Bradyrhizobium mercantei]